MDFSTLFLISLSSGFLSQFLNNTLNSINILRITKNKTKKNAKPNGIFKYICQVKNVFYIKQMLPFHYHAVSVTYLLNSEQYIT